MKQGKVVICNLIMMAVSVAAIITLILGSFMKITLSLHVNGDSLSAILGEETGNTGNENEANNVNTAEGEEESIGEGIDLEKALKSIDFSIDLSLDLKSMDLLGSIAGDASDTITSMVKRELAKVVDSLLDSVDDILTSAVNVLVDEVLEKAEEEIKNAIGEAATDEEVKAALAEKGIEEQDIENLKDDIGEAIKYVVDGEPEKISELLQDSETLSKLIAIYAKDEIQTEDGVEPTQEQIDAKVEEIKNDVIKEYNEAIDEMKAENGEFSKDTILVGIMQNAGLKDENENEIKFETVQDVEDYIAESIVSSLGSMDGLGMIFKILGIFLLVVIAAWAYFLVKLVVKTFSPKNKTVGMFFPRFFGWMPHVIFVGIPMTIFKNVDKILTAIAENANLGEVDIPAELVNMLQMFSIKVTSLTWVSALCTLILLVIWFPYYHWRRQIKRENKYRR